MKSVLGGLLILFNFAFLVITFGDWRGWAIAYVLDVPSLMPFIWVMAAIIIMTGDYKVYVKSVNAILSKKYTISNADKERAVQLYRLLSKAVLYTAFITFIIGLIMLLGQFEDISTLGPMITLSVIPPLYGAIINMVFIHPAIYILKNRENSEPAAVISEKLVVQKLLDLCYRKGISPEEIMEAEDISFGNKN